MGWHFCEWVSLYFLVLGMRGAAWEKWAGRVPWQHMWMRWRKLPKRCEFCTDCFTHILKIFVSFWDAHQAIFSFMLCLGYVPAYFSALCSNQTNLAQNYKERTDEEKTLCCLLLSHMNTQLCNSQLRSIKFSTDSVGHWHHAHEWKNSFPFPPLWASLLGHWWHATASRVTAGTNRSVKALIDLVIR